MIATRGDYQTIKPKNLCLDRYEEANTAQFLSIQIFFGSAGERKHLRRVAMKIQ